MKILKIADYQPHKVDSLLAGNKEYKKLGTSDRKVCSRKKNRSRIF